ncbi:TIR domain-containing protein [Pseudokineococcus basanitobsidens]|uniref:TIR domain-containing protein n=1 Tax=Pseudokineococcus basanitobsidens TaxID=1926649 RepID=A0ABU8RF06_9ACTN
MPSKPLLDVVIIHHPDDKRGAAVVEQLLEHFHGAAYAGLVGGSVEVYPRAAAWDATGQPRTALLSVSDDPSTAAEFTAVLPVYSRHLYSDARVDGPWTSYLSAVAQLQAENPEQVLLAPICPASLGSPPGGLGRLPQQHIRHTDGVHLRREVSQMLTQWLRRTRNADAKPVSVFVSHAKADMRSASDDAVTAVRSALGDSHLNFFFDAVDIQPAENWKERLTKAAEADAMLIVRTDHYATREWTLTEASIAKTADKPVVALLAQRHGEPRGSFLLDNVPTVPYTGQESVRTALLRLVDECLKHALWRAQTQFTDNGTDVWTPARAPEPLTLARRLGDAGGASPKALTIVHPDPPLTDTELLELAALARGRGVTGAFTVNTPRTAATSPDQGRADGSPAAWLGRLTLSVSNSADLSRLGLTEKHLELLVAEVSRAVLLAGAGLAYGGRLSPRGFTDVICDEVERSGREAAVGGVSEPLVLTVPLPGHQRMQPQALDALLDRVASYGRIELIGQDGRLVQAPENADWAPTAVGAALTAMRLRTTEAGSLRLLVGGRLRGFTGSLPGVVEEAIATIDAGQPLYVAAGFGGAAAFVARELEIDDLLWAPGANFPSGALDDTLALSREKLRKRRNRLAPDGLSPEDRALLMRSHRPGDIGLVMGRVISRLQGRDLERAQGESGIEEVGTTR